MSRLKVIKLRRAIAGDPALPAAVGYAAMGLAQKVPAAIRWLGKLAGKIFGRGGSSAKAIAAMGVPAAAGYVSGSAAKKALAQAAAASAGAGAGYLFAKGFEEEEKKKRRRKGLSACEIRGFYRVMRLIRRAGYRPKAPCRRR